MRKPIKIVIGILVIALSLACLALGGLYYVAGMNYFALGKTFNKIEIEQAAKIYSKGEIFLIKRNLLKEYGQGRFPKYKIYTGEGKQLDIYECYESLPNLPDIISKKRNAVITNQLFEGEIKKLRTVNVDTVPVVTLFIPGKYNMIFYYKYGLNRLQQKQLHNILTRNLGAFNDSLNVVFVNVDKVDF